MRDGGSEEDDERTDKPLEALGLDEETMDRFLHHNAAEVFGLS